MRKTAALRIASDLKDWSSSEPLFNAIIYEAIAATNHLLTKWYWFNNALLPSTPPIMRKIAALRIASDLKDDLAVNHCLMQ